MGINKEFISYGVYARSFPHFLLILISHSHTLTVHTFIPNYMFQPNVAIIRFEYMFEVIALGQSHIYSSMLSHLMIKL
jgi:hypothetical protein